MPKSTVESLKASIEAEWPLVELTGLTRERFEKPFKGMETKTKKEVDDIRGWLVHVYDNQWKALLLKWRELPPTQWANTLGTPIGRTLPEAKTMLKLMREFRNAYTRRKGRKKRNA